MNKIGSAFAKAWSDLKATAVAAKDFVAKNAPAIVAATGTVSTVLDTLDPAAAPAVTAFDDLETLVLGHVAASVAASNTAPPKPASTFSVSLPAELFPVITEIADMLKTHPAVVAASK
jgi:hypothetical protein